MTSALAAARGRRAARPSAREQRHLAAVEAWADGRTSRGDRSPGKTFSSIIPTRRARAAPRAGRLFLPRATRSRIRDSRRARAAVLGREESARPASCSALYAFGLEETGELGRAEGFGARGARAATPTTPGRRTRSPMSWRPRSRQEEGVAFLKASRADWSPAHFMAGHNGWHLALYLIEERRVIDEVLADYDRFAAPKARRRRDARPRRRRVAAVAPRTRRRRRRRPLGARSRGSGWRMSTTTRSPSTTCISRCAAARSPNPDDARALRDSLDGLRRATGDGDNRDVHGRGRRRCSIEGVLDFAEGDYAGARRRDAAGRATRRSASAAATPSATSSTMTLIAAAERSGQWQSGARAARRARRRSGRPRARSWPTRRPKFWRRGISCRRRPCPPCGGRALRRPLRLQSPTRF